MADLQELRNQLYTLEKPSSSFDGSFYAQTNPDVAGDKYYGSRLEEHYNRHGKSEGRSANQAQSDFVTGATKQKIEELKLKIVQEENYNSLAAQIKSITEANPKSSPKPKKTPTTLITPELAKNTSSENIFLQTALGSKLNFQVSDQQIVDDYNNSYSSRLNKIIGDANAQIAGIRSNLEPAQKLLQQLPANDPRRLSSDNLVKKLQDDLASVTSAVTSAQDMQKNFKPITAQSPKGAKEITSFRSFLQLPEERATQQLRQIDPESYQTSVALGQKYRQMATAPIGPTQNAQTEAFRAQLEKGYRDYSTSPIGATTTPETEALRQRIEGEAMAQLSLGAQLGAEEQRAYQQAARGAQSARGNIFGVAPAVEEAVTTGAAGEQRKLARYGAASQFLSSGQTTGDALARDVQLRNALQQSRLGTGGQFLTSGQTMSDALRGDIAFRDALQQNRLGAAANFIGGGPSIGNLAGARTAQQQGAFQNYIQANQPLPGGFNQQPSTAANFYQTTNPEIPVALTNAFNSLYSSMAGYQANTYGAQVGAISRQPSGAQQFAQIAGGIGSLLSPLKFG